MRLKKYANLLTSYCLELKPKEKILVRTTTLAEPFLKELHKAILEVGAIPEYDIAFEDQARQTLAYGWDHHLKHTSEFYKKAVETFDAILNIRAPFNVKALNDIPSEKKLIQSKAIAPIKKTFMKRSAKKKLKWCLCVYPTQSAAQECGLSLHDYENFVYDACYLNKKDPIAEWKKLSAKQQTIVDKLNKISTIRFIGPNGTDITFSTKKRIWINSDGLRNMPSGEVFTSPVENSGNGTVYFSYPTLYQGQDVQGVTLTVKKGKVINWEAEVGQDALDQAFALKGSRVFGEIAIGTNTQIKRATKNILFDEKIGGSIHMAVGASYPETGGKNESALHWDMITDMTKGGRIEADGKLIYKNGKFI